MSFVRTRFATIPNLYWVRTFKGPNNKFVERGYKKTRLTSKEKRLNLTLLDGLTQILPSISSLIKLSSYFIRFSSKYYLFRSPDPFFSMHSSMLYTALLVSSSPHTCRLGSGNLFLSHPTPSGTSNQ